MKEFKVREHVSIAGGEYIVVSSLEREITVRGLELEQGRVYFVKNIPFFVRQANNRMMRLRRAPRNHVEREEDEAIGLSIKTPQSETKPQPACSMEAF